MGERRTSPRIKRARLNAMFSAMDNGATSSEDILAAAKIAEKKVAMRIGNRSEMHFQDYAIKYTGDVISSVKPSSEQENHNKIDYWITVSNNKKFPLLAGKILPVQIKSHDEDLTQFKNSQEFRDNFGKKIVSILVKPKTGRKKFRRRMLSELSRIQKEFR